jgi:hypothetical protein
MTSLLAHPERSRIIVNRKRIIPIPFRVSDLFIFDTVFS